ncbi:rod-binding protein [Phenylobacterium sp.]|uniref:rod-binding protein n=1 Tax=Phenylobacterium sp. TaxID=1871053 RepID=UPI00356AE2C7
MADLTATAVPTNLLATPAAPTAAELAKRGDIKRTAEKFESSFLSIMMQQMFEGTDTPAPFGGGPGEAMFKSFLTEAMAKKMSDRGGIGIAATVQREMLKMQGLK